MEPEARCSTFRFGTRVLFGGGLGGGLPMSRLSTGLTGSAQGPNANSRRSSMTSSIDLLHISNVLKDT